MRTYLKFFCQCTQIEIQLTLVVLTGFNEHSLRLKTFVCILELFQPPTRQVISFFCSSLIDDNCYVLFYYNGHALGYGSDIYLVARDSNISADMVSYLEAFLLSPI